MITTRREVVAFRGMSQEQQATFLATLWPSGLRSLYLRMLDPDESYEVDGSTARFPFPRAERRLYGYLALGLGATCLVPLAVAVFVTALPGWARLVVGLLGLGVAVPFVWVLGRLALLETTLEVTPFSVRLVGPGPRRVTFLFNRPLHLTGGFPDGYYELVAAGGGARLRIHLARLGAIHALHLIWTYGVFTPTDAPPDAPARSPFDLTFKDEANST